MTPAPCRGEWAKIIGYWRKVEALPVPDARKMTSINTTNKGNWSNEVGASTPEKTIVVTPPNMTTPDKVVRTAPPVLSLTGPMATLKIEPTSGPRKANFNGSGASAKPP